MVVFDLKCSAGHRFEGWFDDLRDLRSQLRKGLLACPSCGDASITQVPAGFAVSRKKGQAGSEDAAAALGRAMARHLKDNFEDVGPGFAKEALKIHYGASEPRNIRGVSTADEEKMLSEEGVSFFKLPPAPDQNPGNTGDDED